VNRDPNDNSEIRKGTTHIGKLKSDQIKSSSPLLTSEPQQLKRILVIDDNPDIVLTLRVGLESDPTIKVFGFNNPITALDCIAAINKFNGLQVHFKTTTFSSPSTKSFPNSSLIVALMVIILVASLFPVITPSTISS